MYEYIKRTDAIAEINRGDLLVGNCAEWAREIIWRCPYADVREVGHGHWDDGCCTACGFDIRDLIDGEGDFRNWVWEGLPYCPNCGSDMRGIEDGQK